jgi:hypothetical protein
MRNKACSPIHDAPSTKSDAKRTNTSWATVLTLLARSPTLFGLAIGFGFCRVVAGFEHVANM